jgi:hypothetical protein
MKWVELIELRSIDRDLQMLKGELQNLIESVNQQTEQANLLVFHRALIHTDFCIQILHDSSEVKNQGSRLGLRIASSLKSYGLVYHSIWINIRP